MTAQPPQEQFTAGGNVRVTDLLTSIAKEIDRILVMDKRPNWDGGQQWRMEQFRGLAKRVRRLAETIERGK